MLEVFEDITEQKTLQQELLQSQKMLSIGTLAGGIAHDFNNILGIILGYISIMQSIKDNPQKFSEGIHAIRQAVDRGTGLVRQILTFARKAEVSFEPLYIPDLVKELVSMLQQTFPKIITFQTSFDRQLPLINADYTQIHQALLNLCVNARDALPNGGEILIEAVTTSGEKTRERFPAANLTPYICVSVSDTGVGMEESTRSRIFDPFFTTKEKGKGTGLGLSVVYGIVHAHHGFINCESRVGEGTAFHIYLPVPEEPANSSRAQTKEESIAPAGNETVLLVEDEDLLLEMMETLLKTRGYGVYKAKDGIEAVELYKRHKDEISLVLTDMGLPKLTGMDEFERLKDINPDIKLIFASGYLDPRAKDELIKAGAKGFLQKPYVIEEVLKKVREALDSK
jgi:two-component system cell cycle sensor histidine kinase/response regulator CckA